MLRALVGHAQGRTLRQIFDTWGPTGWANHARWPDVMMAFRRGNRALPGLGPRCGCAVFGSMFVCPAKGAAVHCQKARLAALFRRARHGLARQGRYAAILAAQASARKALVYTKCSDCSEMRSDDMCRRVRTALTEFARRQRRHHRRPAADRFDRDEWLCVGIQTLMGKRHIDATVEAVDGVLCTATVVVCATGETIKSPFWNLLRQAEPPPPIHVYRPRAFAFDALLPDDDWEAFFPEDAIAYNPETPLGERTVTIHVEPWNHRPTIFTVAYEEATALNVAIQIAEAYDRDLNDIAYARLVRPGARTLINHRRPGLHLSHYGVGDVCTIAVEFGGGLRGGARVKVTRQWGGEAAVSSRNRPCKKVEASAVKWANQTPDGRRQQAQLKPRLEGAEQAAFEVRRAKWATSAYSQGSDNAVQSSPALRPCSNDETDAQRLAQAREAATQPAPGVPTMAPAHAVVRLGRAGWANRQPRYVQPTAAAATPETTTSAFAMISSAVTAQRAATRGVALACAAAQGGAHGAAAEEAEQQARVAALALTARVLKRTRPAPAEAEQQARAAALAMTARVLKRTRSALAAASSAVTVLGRKTRRRTGKKTDHADTDSAASAARSELEQRRRQLHGTATLAGGTSPAYSPRTPRAGEKRPPASPSSACTPPLCPVSPHSGTPEYDVNGILDAFETQRMAEAYGAAGKALRDVSDLQRRMILAGPKRSGTPSVHDEIMADMAPAQRRACETVTAADNLRAENGIKGPHRGDRPWASCLQLARPGYNADGSMTAEPPLEELTDSDDDTPAPAPAPAAAAAWSTASNPPLEELTDSDDDTPAPAPAPAAAAAWSTASNPPLEGLTDSDEETPPPAQAAAPAPLLRIKTTPVGELEQRPDSQTLQPHWRNDKDVPWQARSKITQHFKRAKQPRDPRQQPVRSTPVMKRETPPATRPSPGAARPGPQPAPPARTEAPAPPAAAAPGSTETAVQAGAGAEQQPPPRRSVRQRAERTKAQSAEAPSLDG